jgi:hypothetical protein
LHITAILPGDRDPGGKVKITETPKEEIEDLYFPYAPENSRREV